MKNQMETVTFLPMVLSHDAQLLVKSGKHPECQTRRQESQGVKCFELHG